MNKYRFHLLLFTILTLCFSIQVKSQPLDNYGGNKSMHFNIKNNGFFRTHFDGHQWWLVTPDNNAFLSFGLNHFHAGLWRKKYNKAHWEKEFGGAMWTPEWAEGFYQQMQKINQDVGANSLGYHNEDRIIAERTPTLPYIKIYRPLRISLHQRAKAKDYIDVFSDRFKAICRRTAQKQIAPIVDDTLVIGIAMADVPILTEGAAYQVRRRRIPTWAMVLRNLPASAPGKQAYIDLMKTRYASVQAFNGVYNTDFASWDALLQAENWREKTNFSNTVEVEDNNAFNMRCMHAYYRTALAAIREVDTHHLFLGDKLNALMRSPKELDMVVNVAKEYVDVLLYQYFGKGQHQKRIQNRIAAIAKRPILNGDGGFGAHGDPNMPMPQRPAASNQRQRALWLYSYAEDAFTHPNFVGWYLCGVIDSWGKSPVGRQKPGIMTPVGEPHTEVIESLHKVSTDLYRFRDNKQ